MSAFSRTVFDYLTTIVPYWRVSDNGWRLGNGEHVAGIGVLRNYGGQVMIVPWDEGSRRQLTACRKHLRPLLNRMVVVIDDAEVEDVKAVSDMLAPITVVRWSDRARLSEFAIKDEDDNNSKRVPKWNNYVRPARKRLKLRWHRVVDGVRYVLVHQWHPLGNTGATDEYDSCALTIAGMLLRACSVFELNEFLVSAERQLLGHSIADGSARNSTVKSLMQFRDDDYPATAFSTKSR